MKKIIAGLGLMLLSTVLYAKPYVCVAYTDGVASEEPMTVNATKTPIAEDKAYDRLRKKGKKVDYVKCK
ncbi:hypothetical protein [Methyloprofundus sp.]|uniref:hypothetical protein n=1 Tax=Methyloprofundus sp. TaxID=2020875 RepID=UPI003D0FA4FE